MKDKVYQIQSPRVEKLRESVLSKVPGVCIERARYITEAYQENEAAPIYLKRAKAVEKILQNMSIYIKDGELIVGNQASDERTAPIFPEYGVEWMEAEIEVEGNFDKRPGDNFYLPKEHIDELLDLIQYWKGKTLHAKCYELLPEEVKRASKVKVIHGEGNMTSGDGHIVPDFEKVLNKGLEGIIAEAQAELEKLDLGDLDAIRKKAFWEGTILTNESVINFAKRYAQLAKEQAEQVDDPARKEELIKIADVCERTPAKAPRNFYEAVQAIWFIHLVLQIESNGHSASLGRVDQYLYPFYKKDIKEGVITKDFAKELLECLWVKLFSIIKLRPTSHAGYGAGYPTYQNVTIGGQNPQGKDETNELTYLILESVGEMKLTQPNLSVRVHANSPERLLREAAQVIKTGYGMPALHNDEIIIPSLLDKGVSYEDAYGYTMVGCVEVAVPGKWGYRCTGMTFLNMLKALELTLNDGVDPRTGIELFKGQGSLKDFASFDELWKAWEAHIAYYTKLSVIVDHVADTQLEEFPDMLCSSLVGNCIERGKTVKEGGAVYDMVSGLQVGIANVANSMAAIKKYIFEEKSLTAEELMEVLANDFAGDRGKFIQKMLLDAPKYGNGDDYVDQLAVDAYKTYMDEIKNYKNTRYGRGPIGGNYYMSTSGISSNVPMGTVTGATPDGRNAATPAAEGASPTQGTDVNGPTGVLNSITKFSTIMMTGGQLLNQKFPPELLAGKSQFDRFVSFIKAFINLKAWHIQFNIVSSETLRAAQQNPEKYRDLIVRVAGYCAQFVTLDKKTQDDIIARTEQKF
ncbi:glycyl radical enzyme [Orenia metallireducens]|uniref:Glycyl radical enzyme n=1 Tax=Orenia metallireducens TaxID=1413210 RepID=A0A1C0A9L3_9FIRM|nr:glycyl radical protein [Orenia metallireducens]OCL26966.1 glycyl radical enzyme [Orenia metallireducens]